MTGHPEGTPRVGESGRGTPDASVLGPDTCEVLRQHAESRGVMLLSTPLDEQTRDDAVAPRLPAIRIPSAELINHPFLAHVAGRGRAILMSTGMATMAEVADAVAVLRAHGDPPLVLLHCVTNSPADASESNLDAMRSLESLFGVPVGWSDNTRGLDVVVAAAARGATIIEKRVRLDRGMVGPHNEASLEADELRMMVDRVRRVESAIGSGIKTPTSAEERIAGLARKSLHAVRDLAPGHELITDDLVAVRPADGIAPAKLATVVGRRLTTSVAAGMPILEQHLGE